jgi:hypothetical protein
MAVLQNGNKKDMIAKTIQVWLIHLLFMRSSLRVVRIKEIPPGVSIKTRPRDNPMTTDTRIILTIKKTKVHVNRDPTPNRGKQQPYRQKSIDSPWYFSYE